MRTAVFMDRDGVINENTENLTKSEQFILINGAAEAIKRINDSGYLVVVVTNQPIIAKGFCSFGQMEQIHSKMKTVLNQKGAIINAIYMCPHHPQKGFPGEILDLKKECDCRKPRGGLLFRAISDLDIDAKRSWMIGDSYTDIAAGQVAGVRTILINSGGGCGSKVEKELKDVQPDYIRNTLTEAVDLILSTKD